MEDGSHRQEPAKEATIDRPPPPPNPNTDLTTGHDPTLTERSDQPLRLSNAQWDITRVSAVAALRMLQQALQTLTEATGDVPPTPPISRPTTPNRAFRRPSSPITASSIPFDTLPIGSPEAHPCEPIRELGSNAEQHYIQHAAIARRFFSKTVPPFSITEYLERQHTWCPHSPGVYLAAAHYINRLCVTEFMVPATNRTIHRLALAAIRVAAKALEDNKWPQDRVAKVGGISRGQLMNLEVTLCFLLDFELWIDDNIMAKSMFTLQQAARHGGGVQGSLREGFRMAIPVRRRPNVLAVAS
jgi:hypothetical protein